MPKIKFKMILPPPGGEDNQPIIYKCKSCGESMRMDEIDGHAKREHNATSVMVDTTT